MRHRLGASRDPRLLPALLAALLLGALLSGALAPAAAARDVLTVRVLDADGTEIARHGFDRVELEAHDTAVIETTTPWTEDVVRFSGPRLSSLAALAEAPVAEARLSALNDYTITVPAQDWATWTPVLATRADGAPMRVRDKGPLWLIYPLDADPALRTQRYHARMIWQVRELVLVTEAP